MAQKKLANPTAVVECIHRLKSGEYDCEMLASQHATKAVPPMEEAFARETEVFAKAKICRRPGAPGRSPIGVLGLPQWTATAAASEETRTLLRNDGVSGAAPEFTAWAKAHKTTEEALQKQGFQNGMTILALAEAGDPSGERPLRLADWW